MEWHFGTHLKDLKDEATMKSELRNLKVMLRPPKPDRRLEVYEELLKAKNREFSGIAERHNVTLEYVEGIYEEMLLARANIEFAERQAKE